MTHKDWREHLSETKECQWASQAQTVPRPVSGSQGSLEALANVQVALPTLLDKVEVAQNS